MQRVARLIVSNFPALEFSGVMRWNEISTVNEGLSIVALRN